MADTAYPDDAALEAAGYASGWAVWDVIKNDYGDALGDDELAEAQLESLKRAILAGVEMITYRAPESPAEAASNGRDRFEDERGVIQDLLGQVDAVTEIFTKAGKIRGNHVHARTTQWTYVVSGRMTFAWTEDDGRHIAHYPAGSLVTEAAGIPHAWRAVEDTRVLVFTRGPRSGQAYETDTTRLPENARLL